MRRVLVLAIGNTMRGDDGIGWHAAKALTEESTCDDLRVLFCEQLTPDLAEAVSVSERVIFIDSSVNSPAGCVAARRVDPSMKDTESFSHEIGPESLLFWSRALYGTSPEAVLITVGGESFEAGEGLSPSVAKSLPALLACVRERIAGDE